jgi:dethiobiotin synthetase
MPHWDVRMVKISAEKVTRQLHPTNKVHKIKLVETPSGYLVPCAVTNALH